MRIFSFGLLTTFLLGVFSACHPAPPAEGVCNEGRSWVAPEKVDGVWNDGYCRAIR